jgi:hypothetical protein
MTTTAEPGTEVRTVKMQERQSPQERRRPQPERQKPPTRSRSRTEAYRIVDSFPDAPQVFSKSDLDPALATVAGL